MPPSPRLTAKVDEAAYRRACDELNIDPPSIVVTQLARTLNGRPTYGIWQPGRITIYLGGIEKYTADRLRAAQGELVDTVLHELRHAYQYNHNPDILDNKHACEVDAEGWAKRKRPEYRTIIRLSRTYPNSGFSRLSRHASRREV